MGGWTGGSYFDQGGNCASSKYSAPSHFVGIKSDKYLIINRCDFETLIYQRNPAQNFTIESSINGKYWNILYRGTVPNNKWAWQTYNCEFNPTRCKYIRCIFNSVAHEMYIFSGEKFKFYGALSINQDPFLYTNPDAYGIPKED